MSRCSFLVSCYQKLFFSTGNCYYIVDGVRLGCRAVFLVTSHIVWESELSFGDISLVPVLTYATT